LLTCPSFSLWHTIHCPINDLINEDLENKYMITDKKINIITLDQINKQTNKPNNNTRFTPE